MVDERRVRAVLEQTADEIRQQVFVRTHWRVGANAWERLHMFTRHFVERLAHAMQALELKLRALRGKLQNHGHRERVMRGELRIEHIICSKQPSRADEITHIRSSLGSQHREAEET